MWVCVITTKSAPRDVRIDRRRVRLGDVSGREKLAGVASQPVIVRHDPLDSGKIRIWENRRGAVAHLPTRRA
jgi:hypothetical protein